MNQSIKNCPQEILRVPYKTSSLHHQSSDYQLSRNMEENPTYSQRDDCQIFDSQSLCRYSNLPRPKSFPVISRQQELIKLLINISPDYRQHITIVEGVDGIGKTEMVLKAAHICCNSQNINFDISIPKFDIPQFEAIMRLLFSRLSKKLILLFTKHPKYLK